MAERAPLPVNETQRMLALRSHGILDTAPEQEFEDAVALAAILCATPMALVSLVDADRQWFKAKVGLAVSETSRDDAFCAHTILNPQGLVVGDALLDTRFADNPLVQGGPCIRFYAGCPLITADGHALGTLSVLDCRPRQLEPVQLEALHTLARQVSRLLALRKQAADELKALQSIQETLEEQQAFLLMAQSMAGLGSWRRNLKTGQSAWSGTAYQLLGADPQHAQASSANFLRHVHPDDLEAVVAERQAARHGLRTGNIEFRVLPPSGGVRHLQGMARLLRDSAGQPDSLVGTLLDITARKQADAALRASEERWKLALDAAGDGVWDWDIPGNTEKFSPRFLEMYGYLPGELADSVDSFDARTHPDDVSRMRQDRQAHLDGLTPSYVNEHRVQCRDGRWKWILSRGMVVSRDAQGRPLRMVGTHTDISTQKAAEQREASRSHVLGRIIAGDSLQEVLKTLVLGIEAQHPGMLCSVLLLDAEGRHLRLGAAPSLPDDYNRAIDGAMIGPAEGSCGTAAWTGQRVIAQDVSTDARWPGYRDIALAAGLASCWSEPIVNGQGKVVGTFAVYHRQPGAPSAADIETIESAAQIAGLSIEHHHKDQALRASEERFRALTALSSDWFWEQDAEFRFTLVSEGDYQNRGSDREYAGATRWELNPLTDWTQHRQVLERHEPFRNFEFSHIDIGGRLRTGLISGIPLFDSDGRFTGYRGVGTDITVQKEEALAREQLQAQLREAHKMEALGTLAGGVAHDFNNILGAILGNVELASEDLQAGHPALRSLSEIRHAGQRAKHLVQQILAFSRKQPHHQQTQALGPLVESALELLRVTVPAGVSMTVRLASEDLYIDADATQVAQVVMNLCTNAWQALRGRQGQVHVRVERVPAGEVPVAALAQRDCACLLVSDTGQGMDTATRERIFEPFFTTRPTGQGTGLGLSVVHGIVQAHGGAITVESQPGQGAVFRVWFPLAAAPAQVQLPASPPATAVQGRGQRVVYIDDDEAMVFMVRRMLGKRGFSVSAYQVAEEALAAIRAHPQGFDLVVTDYNMPGPSGLDVARELRDINRQLPVVVTSGYITEELTAGAAALGVRHVLYKPNTIDELCETIQKLVTTL